jgi:hypothetical protein
MTRELVAPPRADSGWRTRARAAADTAPKYLVMSAPRLGRARPPRAPGKPGRPRYESGAEIRPPTRTPRGWLIVRSVDVAQARARKREGAA